MLPAAVAARIQAFIKAGATGQVMLNVNRGRIESCQVNEYIRVGRAEPLDTPDSPGGSMETAQAR